MGQLDVLVNGSETCKRFMIRRLQGTYDIVLSFRFRMVESRWIVANSCLRIGTHNTVIDQGRFDSLVEECYPDEPPAESAPAPPPDPEQYPEECYPNESPAEPELEPAPPGDELYSGFD